MPRREMVFAEGHFYHIYNRGAQKQKIFYDADNYLYLLQLLSKNLARYAVSTVAYCLMPNHYHFLLRVDENGNLSKCMAHTWNSYVQALNKKYKRKGPLFAERFKAIHIDKPEYLAYLCRYLHRNPLRAGLVDRLEKWAFSNYLEFAGLRNGSLFCPTFFESYFSDVETYLDFVLDDLDEPPKGFDKYILR